MTVWAEVDVGRTKRIKRDKPPETNKGRSGRERKESVTHDDTAHSSFIRLAEEEDSSELVLAKFNRLEKIKILKVHEHLI